MKNTFSRSLVLIVKTGVSILALYILLGLLTRFLIMCNLSGGSLFTCLHAPETLGMTAFWPAILFVVLAGNPFFLLPMALLVMLIVAILMRCTENHPSKKDQPVSHSVEEKVKGRKGKRMAPFAGMFASVILISLGVVGVLSTAYIGYADAFGRFDLQHVPFNPMFQYKNSLTCRVEYSTFESIGEAMLEYYAERQFTLRGLDTDVPELEQAGFTLAMRKTQEGDSAIVLQRIPIDQQDTSVEVLEILKDRGTFTRSYMGFGQYFGAREYYHPEAFHYVIAQKGRCE